MSVLASHAVAQGCDLSNITHGRELHEALSRRAVEIVDRASTEGGGDDAPLSRLVRPEAVFNLGAGDVGGPLPDGPAGARALAATMRASSFRFYGWDYMNMPVDACAPQKVTVEFVDEIGGRSSQVEFAFEEGRLVSARGWQRSFSTGWLPTDRQP
jgi:hypothetical protein